MVSKSRTDIQDGLVDSESLRASYRKTKRQEIEKDVEAELQKEYEPLGITQPDSIKELEKEKHKWTEKVWVAETTEEVRSSKKRKYELDRKKILELQVEIAGLKRKEASVLKKK
jgi:hypothetical protein